MVYLEIGNSLHKMFQDLNDTDSGKEKLAEKRMENKKYNIVCRPDDVYVINKNKYLIEYKVINQKSFYSLTAPKIQHYWQWQTTSWVSKIKSGEIIYFLPDTATLDIRKFKVFQMKQSTEAVEIIKNKAIYINNCLKNNKILIMEKSKCKYCDYKKYCKKEKKVK